MKNYYYEKSHLNIKLIIFCPFQTVEERKTVELVATLATQDRKVTVTWSRYVSMY